MLNAVKSVLADVSSVSPCSDEGLTLETSADTLFTVFSISISDKQSGSTSLSGRCLDLHGANEGFFG